MSRKGRRVSIVVSKTDFAAIRKRAEAAGVSCDILASTVLHKYVTGRLRENVAGAARSSHASPQEVAPVKSRVPEPGISREPVELIAPRLLNPSGRQVPGLEFLDDPRLCVAGSHPCGPPARAQGATRGAPARIASTRGDRSSRPRHVRRDAQGPYSRLNRVQPFGCGSLILGPDSGTA
jgi:hypothetical protein